MSFIPHKSQSGKKVKSLGKMIPENASAPTMDELMKLMQMTITAVNALIQRDNVVKKEHFPSPTNPSDLPELEKWDRSRSKEWISRTRQWVKLARLTFGSEDTAQIYARLKIACATDDQVMTLINATEAIGVEQTLDMMQKVYGSMRREDEEILDKILEFNIKPGSKLASNWLYYKALVERSVQLNQYPGHETVSRIFMNRLRTSQFADLAQQIRYNYPSTATIPWDKVVFELEKVYMNWDIGLKPTERTKEYGKNYAKDYVNGRENKFSVEKRKEETRGRQEQRHFPHRTNAFRDKSPCWSCGTFHRKGECPARNEKCESCHRNGHFTRLCRFRRQPKEQEVSAIEMVQEFLADTGSEANLFGKTLRPVVKTEGGIQIIRSPIGGRKTVREASVSVLKENGELVQLKGFFDPTASSNILRPTSLSLRVEDEDYAVVEGHKLPVHWKGVRPYLSLKVVAEESAQTGDARKAIMRKLGFTLDPNEEYQRQLRVALEVVHRRLLHPGEKGMVNTLKVCGIDGCQEQIRTIAESCRTCRERNAEDNFDEYRSTHAEITLDRSRFGHHLTADVGFADKKSEHGHIGFSIVKCKETNFFWARAIGEKSEVQGHLIDVMNGLQDVRTLHTDGGREYGGVLTRYLQGRAITHITSPRRSDESSGSIEIAVKRMKILIATALKEFRLSQGKWHWVIRAAVEAHNKTADHTRLPPVFKRDGTIPELDLLPTSEFVLTVEDNTTMQTTRGKSYIYIGTHTNGVQFDFIALSQEEIDWKSDHRRYINKYRPKPTPDLLNKDYQSTLDIPQEGEDETRLEDYQDSEEGEPELIEISALNFGDTRSENKTEFIPAMEKELKAFYEQRVFCDQFAGAQTIPAFWILTRKTTGPKARLTALGNLQQHNPITTTELPSIDLLRMLLYRAVSDKLEITILDITSAFLHAELEQHINIKLPNTLPSTCPYTPGSIVGVRKAIYGLKEAPRLFINKVRREMEKKGWKLIMPGLFQKDRTYVFIYVDDAVIIGDPVVALRDFGSAFHIGKVEELEHSSKVLGMNLEVDGDQVIISLEDWCNEKLEDPDIRGILTRNCIECDPKKEPNLSLTSEGRKLLGLIGWMARLNVKLAFLQSHLSSAHANHPCSKIMAALKKVLKQAKNSPPRMIYRKREAIVNLFTDASFQRLDGQARVGYLITINEDEKDGRTNVISFGTKKLKKKLLSTYAAELEAIVYGLRNFALLLKAIEEVIKPKEKRLWTDSATVHKSLIGGRSDEGFSAVVLEVARDYISQKNISCFWTPRIHQHADALTHFAPLD